jgi:hypothetical protein
MVLLFRLVGVIHTDYTIATGAICLKHTATHTHAHTHTRTTLTADKCWSCSRHMCCMNRLPETLCPPHNKRNKPHRLAIKCWPCSSPRTNVRHERFTVPACLWVQLFVLVGVGHAAATSAATAICLRHTPRLTPQHITASDLGACSSSR